MIGRPIQPLRWCATAVLAAFALAPASLDAASTAGPAGAALTAEGPAGAAFATAGPAGAASAEWAIQQVAAPTRAAYQQGREALNFGDLRRAADLFAVARDGAPGSRFAADAAYWEAFALYRLGGAEDYRRALEVLEAQRGSDAETGRDTEELYVRIRAALAMSGDPGAVAAITRSAEPTDPAAAAPATITVGGRSISVTDALGGFPGGAPACARGEHGVRIAELAALRRVRDELALPVLRNVLALRDECSAPLRRQAVLLTAQTETEEVGPLLVDVARHDPDPGVRAEAVFWLSKVPGDEIARALSEVLTAARDPAVRERAAFALSRHDSPVARQALQRLVTEESAAVQARLQAVDLLAADVPARDPAFLADAYADLESARVRLRVIEAVGFAGEPWAADWLRARALDPEEPADSRKAALFRLGQASASVQDLVAVLRGLETEELRGHAVFVVAQRPGWEASRVLLDLARETENPELRDLAVFWLEQRRDPTALAALADLGLR